ncbi:hypothetical protein ABZ461_15295 [Actinacidiphila glaucinigra]
MRVACACGGHPPSWTSSPVGHAPGEVVLHLPSAGTAKVLRTLDDFARHL